MEYAPEEFFLYPLYVRPLTGLGRRNLALADDRLACYRAGRDFLLHAGYEQVSMRMFRKPAPNVPAPEFCCQTDGMLGLGCGARSYTRGLHYSSEYAVSSGGVDAILANYEARSFGNVAYGFRLDDAEQRRRFVLQSILNVEGLALDAYRRRFGTSATDDLPQLAELVGAGYLAPAAPQRLVPTPAGLEYSDAMGPWLFSPAVRQLMREYELR